MLERAGLLPGRLLYLVDDEASTPEAELRSKQDPPEGPILPEDPTLEASVPPPERLAPRGVEVEHIPTVDPNSDRCREALRGAPGGVVVYSGPGGTILDGATLQAADQFLHVHAGMLPAYRGSTTIYYSLLNGDACGATAFLMTQGLDQGPVVHSRSFPPPQDPETLDLYYDPWIRAKVLVEVLERYQATGQFEARPQDPDDGETYFIIHPVLKHLSILGQEGQDAKKREITR